MSFSANKLDDYVGEMTFIEFLQCVKTLKMLYGRDVAEKFFTDNIRSWYNVDNASFLNTNREVSK